MTPHPLATYAQMTVSPQRQVLRQRRRRRAARVLLRASFRDVPGTGSEAGTSSRVPAQRAGSTPLT